MASTLTGGTREPVQDRPGVAGSRRPLSLETRLALSVALSVALVIGLLTIVGLRVAAERLDNDLRETARVTAVALADDLELQPEGAGAEAISPVAHDFMAAAPSLSSITVFRNDPTGLAVLASTSSVPAAPESLVARALSANAPVWLEPSSTVATVAVPAFRGGKPFGVVAVSVSLATIQQFRSEGWRLALGGTLAAILAITILIHLLARRLVLRPVQEIGRAMTRVSAGEMSARVEVVRRDELGELAAGLNEMLAELDDLHRRLNERVARATEALRQRNEQLVRSYESVLALREAAARAQQLAAVGQTMANVAHQIGTPLNLVSGHVQLLRQESGDPSLHRRLRIIEEQVERVTVSVRELLERARPHGAQRPVDVSAMLGRLCEAMRPRLAASGVTIDASVSPQLTVVAADEAQLELALLNVVTNALDAMPHGGRLTIRAHAGPGGTHIEIADTGTGIPAELLPRIFEPWLTTKTAGRGAGLGLSITRDVISSLGGTIAARSTPGSGSTFVIELPAAPAEVPNA